MRDLAPTAPVRRADFAASRYVWAQDPKGTRNQFVSFEQSILKHDESALWLHLFADTRYRLFVNERFVAYGPARFVTGHPAYDSFDLAPYLDQASNLVRVEVNYYGASSYQSMVDGAPGFIAAGRGDGYDFCTPGDWRVRVHHAWDPDAALFSFAQNPAEICDTRTLADELTTLDPTAPQVVDGGPWGDLQPRLPLYPQYDSLLPKRVVKMGKLMDDWQVVGFQSIDPDFEKTEGKGQCVRRFQTWLYSPREQTTELQCFWSDLELNGEPLHVNIDTKLGNHGCADVCLRQGWNLLSGRLEVLIMQWSYLLGVTKESGVSFHALPDRHESRAFALSPVEPPPRDLLPYQPPESYSLPVGWSPCDGGLESLTPARVIAWDRFDETSTITDIPCARFEEVNCLHSTAACWNFDFGDEFFGHPVIEVDAPAGTILDLAYDDWLSDRGMVDLYVANPFTDAADRFILRGGRQRIEVCNPRGGIFFQVTLRSPHSGEAVDLQLVSVAIRSRRTLSAQQSTLSSGNRVMDWAFATSLHTLVASTDEGYADCPWRERGAYIGDGYVNLHLNRLLTADLSTAQYCLRLFAQAQNADGQLPPVAPAWLTRPHEDFTLIWILLLRDYWALSGDHATVRALWPTLQRIWASPVWQSHPSGLWNVTESMSPFIDWGVLPAERRGDANAVVNLFRFAALGASRELAEQIGHTTEASQFASEAASVEQALHQTLWNEASGCFAPFLGGDTPAVHANILALRFGIGDPDRLITYLEPRLQRNFQQGIEHGQDTGYAELYFFHYLLPALANAGRSDLAESLINEHYGFLEGLGYPTLNECFSRAHRGSGSCCHSWSGAAAIYLATQVVGLQQREPGNPHDWILDPVESSLTDVSLQLPVADGILHIRLRREGDLWQADVTAPDSLTITAASQQIQLNREALLSVALQQ